MLHQGVNRCLTHPSPGFLNPNGEVILIEFREGKLPLGPPESLKISRARLLEIAAEAGLQLKREVSDILPYQVLLIFEKKG